MQYKYLSKNQDEKEKNSSTICNKALKTGRKYIKIPSGITLGHRKWIVLMFSL